MILDKVLLDRYVRDTFHDGPPALSASVAHAMLPPGSPAHAWIMHPRLNPFWKQTTNDAADIGTAAHAILLENDRSKLVVVDAQNWQKKDAQMARKTARADGQVAILAEDMAEVEAMVEIARAAWRNSELGEMYAGSVEQTLLWQDGDVWLKSRPDWISYDGRLVVDYKTTRASAEPGTWGRGLLRSMGYDLQAALASRGLMACPSPPRDVTVVFMVQEVRAPYAVSFVGLAPAFVDFASRKLDRAIALWRECMTTGRWPAYPSRIAYVDPPEWEVYRWNETENMAPPDDEEGVDAL